MVSSSEIVGAAKTVTVGGGDQLSVQGIRHDSVLMAAYEEVGQNKTIVVGKAFELVCDGVRLHMEKDVLTIEAEKEISIKTPIFKINS